MGDRDRKIIFPIRSLRPTAAPPPAGRRRTARSPRRNPGATAAL